MPPHIETCVNVGGRPTLKLEPFLELCVTTKEGEKQTKMGVTGNHMKDRRPRDGVEKTKHCDKMNVLKAQ